MSDYPHVPAAFINAIREEGTKAEACDWLQKTWNELCAVKRSTMSDISAGLSEREQVSDTTLRRMLAHIGPPSADLAVSYRTDELHSILTELLARRSGNGGDVRVKALEWAKSNVADRWTSGAPWGEAEIIIRDTYLPETIKPYGWFHVGTWAWFATLEAAKAAAQADFETRILSALEVKP